jgi:hypothetical protein
MNRFELYSINFWGSFHLKVDFIFKNHRVRSDESCLNYFNERMIRDWFIFFLVDHFKFKFYDCKVQKSDFLAFSTSLIKMKKSVDKKDNAQFILIQWLSEW